MSMLSSTYSTAEPNVRTEVHGILYGTRTEPPRGHWVQITRVNLNRPCCVNITSGKWDEPRRDCKACEGLGFFPTLVYVRSRRSYLQGDEQAAAPQIFHIDKVRYYVEHNVFENEKQAELSRLYEIRLDSVGNIVRPIERLVGYNVQVATPFREDSGRIQYWAIDVEKIEV